MISGARTPAGVEPAEIAGRAERSLDVSPDRRVPGYFDDPRQQERLLFHAAKLKGTPFIPHAMIPGAGMDCIHVNVWVYLQTGFLKEFREPKYTLDGGKHLGESRLIAWLKHSGKFAEVTTPQIGDTLCILWSAAVEHHAGLVLAGKNFMHCVKAHGVQISKWNRYRRIITAIYRPILT